MTANEPIDPRAGDAPPPSAGPLALDRLVHEPMRLAVLMALHAHPSLSFNELKRLLGTTDGNLSVHARKLEAADYVECRKSFQGRAARTDYALAPAGRDALDRYLDQMRELIRSIRAR